MTKTTATTKTYLLKKMMMTTTMMIVTILMMTLEGTILVVEQSARYFPRTQALALTRSNSSLLTVFSLLSRTHAFETQSYTNQLQQSKNLSSVARMPSVA